MTQELQIHLELLNTPGVIFGIIIFNVVGYSINIGVTGVTGGCCTGVGATDFEVAELPPPPLLPPPPVIEAVVTANPLPDAETSLSEVSAIL